MKAVQQRVRQLWAGLGPGGDGRTRRSVSTYAQLVFDDAEPLFEQYRRIDFARAQTVQADLARKRTSLKALEQAYVGGDLHR